MRRGRTLKSAAESSLFTSCEEKRQTASTGLELAATFTSDLKFCDVSSTFCRVQSHFLCCAPKRGRSVFTQKNRQAAQSEDCFLRTSYLCHQKERKLLEKKQKQNNFVRAATAPSVTSSSARWHQKSLHLSCALQPKLSTLSYRALRFLDGLKCFKMLSVPSITTYGSS